MKTTCHRPQCLKHLMAPTQARGRACVHVILCAYASTRRAAKITREHYKTITCSNVRSQMKSTSATFFLFSFRAPRGCSKLMFNVMMLYNTVGLHSTYTWQ